MARPRIIALALAGIVSLTMVGTALTSGDGSTPPQSAQVRTSGPTNGAPTPDGSTGTTPGTVGAEGATIGSEPDDAPTPDAASTADAASDTPGVGNPAAPAAPVREVLPGAGTPPPVNPTDPIGDLDDQRPVPAGLDFTAPPKKPAAPNGLGGPDGLAVAPSCSHQCITKGVAYPRGFGAELVVETSVPARLYISAVADLDHNGDYEDLHVDSTDYFVTERTWALDHLEPGQTYYVMAAATDEHDHTAYVWGEFTTLSHRDVFVEFGSGEIVGGPGNISVTQWKLGLDGPLTDVTPGQQGILLYKGLARHVDVDFWMLRFWHEKLCESWTPDNVPQGHEDSACVAWNSTSLDDVDLDQAPAGRTRWTQTSVTRSLHPPTDAGGALPPGYGDPYYFSFEVPITFHVTYS